MPPKYVKTIRDEIFYEYSKMISKKAFGQFQHGFIGQSVKDFRCGKKTMSGTIREFAIESISYKQCAFCGSLENLQMDHLIPKSLGGPDDANNIVWSCGSCNSSRGNKTIYQWLGLKKKDEINRLVAGKYLKELYDLHESLGTLDLTREGIQKLCEECRLSKKCEELDKVHELTCLCLESVIK